MEATLIVPTLSITSRNLSFRITMPLSSIYFNLSFGNRGLWSAWMSKLMAEGVNLYNFGVLSKWLRFLLSISEWSNAGTTFDELKCDFEVRARFRYLWQMIAYVRRFSLANVGKVTKWLGDA